MTQFQQVLDKLTECDRKPRQNGRGWMALCPAHVDRRPSLSIKEGENGVAILHCHAGCDYADVMKALGCDAKRAASPTREIADTYDYVDEGSELLYQTVRYRPKDFKQRRPDGKGGWKWSLKGVRRVLYRLPELLDGVKAGRHIYIVEGEKDADRLHSLGLIATTSPQGAGKWRDEYSHSLRNAKVCILQDNDGPGRNHAEKVARSIIGIASEVKILLLPGLSEKGDVSNWLDNGGTREELKRLIDTTSAWKPEVDEIDTNPLTIPGIPHLTDAGNAERLIVRHGKDIRYCYHSDMWFVWDGKRWKTDMIGMVKRLALDAVRNIYAEAATVEEKDQCRQIAEFALRSESEHKLRAMITIAKSLEGVPVKPEELDSDPWLLNCSNGTLNLKTEEFYAHRREDMITKLIPIDYEPQAQSPLWDKFLEEIMGGDLYLIAFLHRIAGYMLTGITREQKMFFLYGTGCNGKSTFLDTLIHVMGDYARPIASDLLMLRREDSHPTALADLQGVRMAVCPEVEQGRRMAEVRVKELTGMTSGRSLIKARRMRQDYFEFEATHKLLASGNHRPIIKGTDEGIWRRIDLIPFNIKITNPDKELPEKLLAEAPGILKWCFRGCGDWLLHGLAEPPVVEDATKTYRTDMDILGEFLDDRCVEHPEAKVTSALLYSEYRQWCEDNNEYVMSQKKLAHALKDRGFVQRHHGEGRSRTWFGIGLRADANG